MTAIVAAVGLTAFSIASCSTDGEVLSRIAREAGADVTDASDARVVDDGPAPILEDTLHVRCGNDASCTLSSESCCLDLLTYVCVARNTCETGVVACDRGSQCGPGKRCCALSAAFSIVSVCQEGACPSYQLCSTNEECPDAGTCVPRSVSGYAACQ